MAGSLENRGKLRELIDKFQIINKYNVPDTAEAATAFRELAEDGCQIIFSTSHGHEDYLLEVAFEYPNVVFCHFSGVKAASSGLSNVHNYFGDIAQVRYLSGVVEIGRASCRERV